MNPADNPYSKEAQLARGTSTAKKAKLERKKGQDFERQIKAELQTTSIQKIRRGHQAGEGGGLGNSDIQGLHGWHIETKKEKRLRMPDYHQQMKEDCPANQTPLLVYPCPVDGEPWFSAPLSKRLRLACDLIEAAGGTVELPYWVDI